jgi:methionyl aminopeptidase
VQKKGIFYKTSEEVNIIKHNGVLLGKTHAEVAKAIKPGVTTLELDRIAEKFIGDNKAKPSFKGFNGFPGSLCISVNDVVVHGIPTNHILREGDIVSIDCGVYQHGFHADSAYTYSVGNVDEKIKQLLEATKNSLYAGIEQANEGMRIGDIGFAVQQYVEKKGFSVVRELVGHGLGKDLHESPEVPNYGKRGQGLKLKAGMVLAIEPMINMGKKTITQDDDGWTIRTADRKPSAHFEHTIVITNKGKAEILTTFQFIEEVLQKTA